MHALPYTIAPMHPAEAAQTAALLCEIIGALPFYNDEAKQAECARYTADYLRAVADDDPSAVLLARAGGACIGVCLSRYDDGPVWLEWYAASVEWRGRGVGRALLAALIAARTAEGINKLWCDSRTDNHGSLALLKQMGFSELCRLRQHWHGQDYVLLECFLA